MSVLLFIPKSGGSPLESVIMTTEQEEKASLPRKNSRFNLVKGKSMRKLSTDSIGTSSLSSKSRGDDTETECGAESPTRNHEFNTAIVAIPRIRPVFSTSSRSLSWSPGSFSRAASSITTTKPKIPPKPPRVLPDAKQPQLRLTPMGALLGSSGGGTVLKAVSKSQERRIQRKTEKEDYQQSASASKVHLGFYV